MPPNGIIQNDIEYILVFKKYSDRPRKISKKIKQLSKLDRDTEWIPYFSEIWDFPGVRQNSHIAMFPEELPKRLIKMFSFVGDTVLDPFLGSGTTMLAAKKLQRNSIGIEINPEYLPLIKKKVNAGPKDLLPEDGIKVIYFNRK